MNQQGSINKIAKRWVEPDRLVWVILAAIIIFSTFASEFFTSTRNLKNVFFIQPIGLGLASLGQAFVVISGGIDLSSGAAISFMSCMPGRQRNLRHHAVRVRGLGRHVGFVSHVVGRPAGRRRGGCARGDDRHRDSTRPADPRLRRRALLSQLTRPVRELRTERPRGRRSSARLAVRDTPVGSATGIPAAPARSESTASAE